VTPRRPIRKWRTILIVLLGLVATVASSSVPGEIVPHLPCDPLEYTWVEVPKVTVRWQGEIAGEVTQDSVILQARLAVDGKVRSGDVKGRPGIAAFALSTEENFSSAFRTRWMVASSSNDYIVKTRITELEPGTRYYYRLLSGPDVGWVEAGPTGTFRTLDARGVSRQVRLVVVTGMNRFAFRATVLRDGAIKERALGFPALATIVSHEPDFFIGTGDNVYYDCPFVGRAKSRERMRAKWHRQLATPRFATLFQRVPTLWEKDDHDFRYDDADPFGEVEPSAELGSEIFMEQVPVVDPSAEDAVMYRTHRINDLLQIWLVEGRDYRDANTELPGPNKSLWGAEQVAWFKQTLLESDATFKVLISPIPMIGPDDTMKGVQGGLLAPLFGGAPVGQGEDMRKRDNHTNPYGFKDEADSLFDWLSENGFQDKNFYIVCGDRHWQYHSIRPDGFEEFSVGALVDGNARLGREPGDDMSTDPDGLISQPYLQGEASGGFLEITVRPPKGEKPATAEFAFYDEHGVRLYVAEKTARYL